MSLKRLIITLVVVVLAMGAVTAVFDVAGNILLRRELNATVLSQLGNTNVGPTATVWYFKAGKALYLLIELALLSVGVRAGIRFWKEKKGKE